MSSLGSSDGDSRRGSTSSSSEDPSEALQRVLQRFEGKGQQAAVLNAPQKAAAPPRRSSLRWELAQAAADKDDQAAPGLQLRLQRALQRPAQLRSPHDVTEILQVVQVMQDPFLVAMDEQTRRAVCGRLTLETYVSGQRVFNSGDQGDKLYFILNGRVQVEAERGGVDVAESSQPQLDLAEVAFLEAGKVFGQQALTEPDHRRRARVTAHCPTQLLVLTASDWRWCTGQSQDVALHDHVAFLRSAEQAVLESVPEAELRAMARLLREERYTNGQAVARQGGEVDRIILVKQGFCRIVRQLHPRFREICMLYAQRDQSPPTPMGEAATSPRHFSTKHSTMETGASSVEDAICEQLGFGGRAALRRLLDLHRATEADLVMPETAHPGLSTQGRNGRDGNVAGVSAHETAGSEHGGHHPQAALTDSRSGDAGDTVIVDVLRAGRFFGVMELMEGLPYQCSVIADPWAEVFVITKYDLLRNCSKIILHKLFCDYKERLSDERLVHRMKQKNKWSGFKQDLLDEIRLRKHNVNLGIIDRRDRAPRRAGVGNLAEEDYARIGTGEKLWDRRAETPPKAPYVSKQGTEVEHVFHVECQRSEDGTFDVKVQYELQDASMVALDERILTTITTSRARRRKQQPEAMLREIVGAPSIAQGGVVVPMPPVHQRGKFSVPHPRPAMPPASQELDDRAASAPEGRLSVRPPQRLEALGSTRNSSASASWRPYASSSLSVPGSASTGRSSRLSRLTESRGASSAPWSARSSKSGVLRMRAAVAEVEMVH